MAQTLLIGLGGTGSRVVNNVVKELRLRKQDINNGEICCAVLDTNVNDNAAIVDSATGVPVIGTSKAQRIRNYFEDYHHLHMETWCPQSPAFLEESMIDGASELRLKSRIAFMDSLESGVTDQLELMINEVLKNNANSKIRIMIVSSLSGGTGSGMFIQVALWLRKFLAQSQITIRGIFMLPDVFVSTIKDIRDNKTTTVRHYCNAYAAIRELNAITKILKSDAIDLPENISLGDLFDSIRDKGSGQPVYDFAFFVDDKDENGVRLDSIAEYEKMVAQLVYMQLYAPMKDDMYSEEDNAFISFVQNEEPLYGSCGTSKAVYPSESVKNYCAIRAAQDSLTGGWKKIDAEIEAVIEEKKQAEKDGVFSSEVIDTRTMFMKLFEEKVAVSAEETGKDRFFLTISKDPKNETKVKVDGDKTSVIYTDKVEDFIKLLNGTKIDPIVTRNSGTADYALDADSFVAADHTKDELISRVKKDESGLADALDAFDAKIEEYADGIVNSVFPYSMGEVKPSNRCSIYGLLTKADDMGTWNFIHPVAARYVLYKLVNHMEKVLKGIVLTTSRDDALSGGDVGAQFDNKATAETENGPLAFLESKKWYQSESSFLDDFERRYAEFVTTKIALCETYQKEALQVSVYRKLIERVTGLIKQLEAFFAKLGDVQTKLSEGLADNVAETDRVVGKTIYVYATQKNKEAVYKTLDMEADRSNAKINMSVINAIYGRLCAEKRPSNPENASYVNIGVISAFLKDTLESFKAKIDGDANNRENVDLDIFTALCRASDVENAEKGGSAPSDELSRFDISTGETAADNTTSQRYRAAFKACKDKLYRMAAPFLIHDREISDNAHGMVTTRPKTFWGFSPDVVAACPFIGNELGINADLQMDIMYPKNELYCYRAVYGMEALYVPKFNELKGGDYYTCYNAVVSEMVKDANGRQRERAYVRTPHLDMTWHRILPYITAAKQREDENEFFHGFWLALAYGYLKVDRNGNVCILRSTDTGYGNIIEDFVPLTYKNKPIAKNDIVKLINVLKADKLFTEFDIPAAEKRFLEELDELEETDESEAFAGLCAERNGLNPAAIIARYKEIPRHNRIIAISLVSALERVANQIADRCNVEVSERKIQENKYKLYKKIYDAAQLAKGEHEIFEQWEENFDKYEL